jgi:hypothetical protein
MMKRQRLIVLIGLLVAPSLVGQVEHAPTVAQCQADQRLWLSKLETLPVDKDLPSYTTLSLWNNEMGQCQKVDPPNEWKYYNVEGEISDVEISRMIKFLGRQGLWSKFIAEDAAGNR